MKIKKGDNVLVIAGKDRGRKGKVISSLKKESRVVVEGINLKKKHVKPKKQGEKGQIVQTPSPIDASNLKIICPKCRKAARIGHKLENKKKFRICKKCNQPI